MDTVLPDAVRADLQLLVAVGTLWGADALKRFEFAACAARIIEQAVLGGRIQSGTVIAGNQGASGFRAFQPRVRTPAGAHGTMPSCSPRHGFGWC